MKKSELNRMFYELEERLVLLKGEVTKVCKKNSDTRTGFDSVHTRFNLLGEKFAEVLERVTGLEEARGLDYMVKTPERMYANSVMQHLRTRVFDLEGDSVKLRKLQGDVNGLRVALGELVKEPEEKEIL